MRATQLIALASLLSGCFLAPGMQLDKGAAEARGRATMRSAEFKIQPITPQLLQKQAEEQARVAKPVLDPLTIEAEFYQYTIAPHDVLAVTVWGHPELTTPTGQFRSLEENGNPVQADGMMYYPYVGVIEVAGKTVAQVRANLTDRLRRVIQDPQLDVRVAAYRGKRVQVTGMVAQPTAVPISDVPLHVQDAIAAAKGFLPDADWTNVTLTRKSGKAYKLDLLALYERGDVSQNWLLTDGDVLNVGDRNANRVFIVGEVKVQQAKLMTQRRMTLAEALGEAGGIDVAAANPGEIYVIRGYYDAPNIYHLDASSPDALLLATQFQLKPRDVVFVSTQDLTRWSRVMNQMLPTVQGIWETFDIANRSVGPIR